MSGIIGSPIIAGVSSKKLDSTAIAPAYSNTATYVIGAHITRNGALYECIDPVVSAEEWDPSKWKAVNVVDETVHAVAPGSSIGAIEVSTEQKKEDVVVNGLGPVDPTASGDIASLDDGADGIPVKSLTVDVEPVQDLNGYDTPWPPGGGKNLLDITPETAVSSQRLTVTPIDGGYEMTSTGSYGRIGYLVEGLEVGGTYTLSMLFSRPVSSGNPTAIYLNDNGNWDIGKGTSFTGDLGVVAETAVSRTITTTTGIIFVGFYVTGSEGSGDTIQVKNVQLELGDTATAYEPYSNICPISGWTGAKVTRTGKNLLGVQIGLSNTSNGISCSIEADGRIKCVGTSTATSWGFGDSYHVELPAGTYTLSTDGLMEGRVVLVNDDIGDAISVAHPSIPASTFVLDSTAEVHYYIAFSEGVTVNQLVSVQLEIGSTATAYEPYQVESYAISFPDEAGTVYGGTLDVTTGVLTVDMAMVDMSKINWYLSGSTSTRDAWQTDSLSIKPTSNDDEQVNAISSHFARVSYNTTWRPNYIAPSRAGSPYMLVCSEPGLFSDVEALKAWLSGVQLVYEMDTPITYQLTPTEVTTILGVNNIYADTGTVEVTYRSDQLKFAPVDSPAFTGTPIVPTAEAGTDNGQVASTAFVQEAVESSASETLEAARELSDGVQENLDELGLSVVDGALSETANGATETLIKDSTGKRIRDAIYRIAGVYDLTDYKSITAAVRNGDGGKIPNGTTFVVPHSVYGNIEFVVRRKNVDKVYNDANRPTLTIQPKYLLSNNGGSSVKAFQFDRKESLCAALTEAIPAGTVVQFTATAAGNWTAGVYNFTATNEIAAGSYLLINKGCWDGTALDTASIQVYANAKATSASATYAISAGDGGATVNLGTMGVELNHVHRVSYGSNNELESGLLQWLNGTGLMSDIWEQKTQFDMMNTEFTSLHGFLEGFPQDFLNCLGLCGVHNLTNDVYEAPDSSTAKSTEYTHNAYFWLPSRKEIYGTNENTREDSESQFSYYADIATTDADKLMYAKGASSPYHYWLRTPYAGTAYSVRLCCTGNGGALYLHNAYYSYGVAPLAILA